MVSSLEASEVLDRLDSEERRWVEEFRDRVRERFGPRIRDLRIYGSKVRGDAGPESDVDLLVLVEDCDSKTHAEIHEIAHGIGGMLAPMVTDFETYHSPRSRASSFYEEMRRESVRL